jgi:hypothetical protein
VWISAIFPQLRSNGTNKVLNTPCTFLLSSPVYTEAHPRLFTLPAPALSGSLEGPFSLPVAAPIPNPFRIRTSANPLPQLFYNPQLQEPFGSAGNNRLPISEPTHINLLESALTRALRKCGKQRTYKSIGIRTYENCACNLFRIRTYKNEGGGGVSAFLSNDFKDGATLRCGWKKEMGQTRKSVPQSDCC